MSKALMCSMGMFGSVHPGASQGLTAAAGCAPSRLLETDPVRAETEMTRLPTPITLLAILLVCLTPVAAPRAVAQESRAQSWSEVKCVRYGKAWSDILARRGAKGLGREFLDRHDAFLASGCTAKADVCPRSAEELDLANIMVIAAMNAGTASTFLPFACRR